MRTKYPDPAVGDQFGKLTCIGVRTRKAKNGNWVFAFRCECSNTAEVSKHDLFRRGYKSCGCTRKDLMRKKPGEASYATLYDSCRRAACVRGLEFSLTRDLHRRLVNRDCFYCGSPPKTYNAYVKLDGTPRVKNKAVRSSTVELAWITANGIDRFDNSLGYTEANSVPCCADCNRGKWEMTKEEYIAHCRKVISHSESFERAA